MTRRSLLALALGPILAACARDGNGAAADVNAVCRVLRSPVPLAAPIDESSGLAAAAGAGDVVWTHNDSGGEAELYAVGADGRLIATLRVGTARNRDWEDLAAGPCPAGRCLYIGDIGDNEAVRDEVEFYRVPEPETADGEAPGAERFRFTYPGGPRDAEALFVLPDGGVYVISKGRTSNIAVYRYSQPFSAEGAVEMEHVADLTSSTADLSDQVTAADASPDGRWVAVRSYSSLMIFRTADLLAGGPAVSIIDLAPLGELQGEAITIDDSGGIVLTSEASGDANAGMILKIQCSVDAPAAGA